MNEFNSDKNSREKRASRRETEKKKRKKNDESIKTKEFKT